MTYFTGFADEAASDIDGQIQATLKLGWNNIESRGIDNVNIHDISDEKFDEVYGKLQDAGIKINCFGSSIANWAKHIDEPFDSSLEEIKRAVPRMQKLGTKLVRIMSFAVLPDRSPHDQMKEERFKRLRTMVAMFADAGIQPVHENCMNYGGMGWPFTLEILENVPCLKLVFDTGNPVFTDDRNKNEPYPKQSAWEFYSHVKEHIEYIHIKDGRWDHNAGQITYTFPGEGDGDVEAILRDMISNGYNGGISIEPHLSVVHHDSSITTEASIKFNNYVEYGRRLEKIVQEIIAAQ